MQIQKHVDLSFRITISPLKHDYYHWHGAFTRVIYSEATLAYVTLRAETFAGRNFRVSKKTRNLWNKLSRFADFGTNFVGKTFANRGKSLFSREKTFANEQKK